MNSPESASNLPDSDASPNIDIDYKTEFEKLSLEHKEINNKYIEQSESFEKFKQEYHVPEKYAFDKWVEEGYIEKEQISSLNEDEQKALVDNILIEFKNAGLSEPQAKILIKKQINTMNEFSKASEDYFKSDPDQFGGIIHHQNIKKSLDEYKKNLTGDDLNTFNSLVKSSPNTIKFIAKLINTQQTNIPSAANNTHIKQEFTIQDKVEFQRKYARLSAEEYEQLYRSTFIKN